MYHLDSHYKPSDMYSKSVSIYNYTPHKYKYV